LYSYSIEKKVLPEFFDLLRSGKKKYELRINDFECKVGDTLFLREWDAEKGIYTTRYMFKRITHILRTKELDFFRQEDIDKFGFQILSLEG
jgi:ASC-1-like (ASCH) protein